MAERIEAAQCMSEPEHLFPKLSSNCGARIPRINDELPLTFLPDESLALPCDNHLTRYHRRLPRIAERMRTLFDRLCCRLRATCRCRQWRTDFGLLPGACAHASRVRVWPSSSC